MTDSDKKTAKTTVGALVSASVYVAKDDGTTSFAEGEIKTPLTPEQFAQAFGAPEGTSVGIPEFSDSDLP